jgi:hypothetical protein
MTTYRKLASSSIAAIRRALELRLGRLDEPARAREHSIEPRWLANESDSDELAERVGQMPASAFFVDEAEWLRRLLELAAVAHDQDEKLRTFIEEIARPNLESGRALLVFTEYRATQLYLSDALVRAFPNALSPQLIHGSLTLEEKLASVHAFKSGAHFLISTEAGGEGLNLQDRCHVMANYDLPWTPSRLVQRAGRLYRYGQQQVVLVVNLHAADTFDNKLIDLMLQRVETIARDLSPVGAEFNQDLHAEVVGSLLEHLDFSDLLERVQIFRPELAREELEAALARARDARDLEEEYLAYAQSYDSAAASTGLAITPTHAMAFVEGMLPCLGVTEVAHSHSGRVLAFALPEALAARLPHLGRRRHVRVTADRRLAGEFRDLLQLDFDEPLFRELVAEAQGHGFGGLYAAAAGTDAGPLAVWRARFQDEAGTPTDDELLAIAGSPGGVPSEMAPKALAAWLLEAAHSVAPPAAGMTRREDVMESLAQAAETLLARRVTSSRYPNDLALLAAADRVLP